MAVSGLGVFLGWLATRKRNGDTPTATSAHRTVAMSERVARAARFGVRAGVGCACFATISYFFATSRTGWTFSEHMGHLAVAFFGWFAAIFILVFVLAYTFPPPTNRIEFPGADNAVALVLGLLILATIAFVWMLAPS